MTRIAAPIEAARLEDEWLEADAFGGFASGTVGTMRTRRYHALLLTASKAGRVVLVNGIEAWLEGNGERYPLTMQRYAPDLIYPDIAARILSFDTAPWPTWRVRIDTGTTLNVELFVAKATGDTVLRWRCERSGALADNLILKVRPLLSGRDYHALHHENPAFNFNAQQDQSRVSWQPYGDLPAIHASTNGTYAHAPDWYRNFCYLRERERGLDFTEDLATPGVFSFDLVSGEALMILSADTQGTPETQSPQRAQAASDPAQRAVELADIEQQRRAAFSSRLRRSADAYVVSRNTGHTIIAGFPWFTDWGRDTFIAMRGLLITSGRLAEAESILLEWTSMLSEGMLPNRFPDYGNAPEYNSVDASLWFAVAVHDYLATDHASPATRTRLQQTVDAILTGYSQGTRFGIAADGDGLLRAGVPGTQLTWMDARAGDWVVTPRIGKPVEIQALWINALRIASAWNAQWQERATRASQAFNARFIDASTGALFDVIDVDHVAGQVDRALRPNQIFAVGGLPFALLEGAAARAVVEQVQTHLLTPVGLRTLAPSDRGYCAHYRGGPLERDGAYHQGTVWPWLLGPFVEAWLRVHGMNGVSRAEAEAGFLAPLHEHLDHAGLDHVSEVADGDAPHTPGGTPFQAWSLGELLRMECLLARI
ncbi:amylo-alpha-1,6-glucosidase [Paraburkholderia sartisoli]|uniref:Glycogen debranching enzyme, putative n=1 Tax=Paraburkholderia sartisoli TaxID=83784 RepID=A0A1H4HEN3_9BURK|nr:amylo-alpha-1,6-glucosidase [Paraburkholderia sartisoli]SEB20253.1 glycogen debranching enzyme, putative [Paraburkholderia sartisoli]